MSIRLQLCLATLLLLGAWLEAAPAVPGFDRFHAEEATVEGGRLLVQELNCAACHDLPNRIPRPAPDLSAVGDRLAIPILARFIASPNTFKPGTLMPDLNVAAADAEAIAHYLATRRADDAADSAKAGDAATGKTLFHEIGCVACHWPADRLALGRHYRAGALADFLLEPAALRPSGRMPNMTLTPAEAGHLAAYLNPEASAELQPTHSLAAAGKAAYQRHGCARCHEAATAAPLPIRKHDQGCLAANADGKSPNFGLSTVQKAAIQLALTARPETLSAAKTVDLSMEALNCYACHSRLGKGGVELARRDYFHANDPNMHAVGDLGVLPPGLDVVGRKLTAAWLQRIVTGAGGEVRPYLKTRMPRFAGSAVDLLLKNLPEADRRKTPITMDTSGLQRHHRGHYGRALLGTGQGGMACVTCHGLQGQRAIGSGVIDLTHTAERLQPGYFKELLLNPASVQPGTIMPPLFAGRKNADKEIEQIWTYLKEAEQQKLPDGLLREDTYELFPAKAGRPIVFRTFIDGVGTHAVAVGYPEGVNAAFDAYASRWALLWRGRFLNAGTTWTDRFSAPDKPLGTAVKGLPSACSLDGAARFGGYRLEGDGRPVFLYSVDQWQIEDALKPQDAGFARQLTITGPDGELSYRPLLGGAPRQVVVKNGLGTIEELLSW